MTSYAVAAALVAAAFLVGGVPTGVLVARWRGIDLRAVGSGNIGATNAARALGKRWGALVLVVDALKGALPMIAALALELDTRVDPFVLVATGFSAIFGHCFSAWQSFRGGKGVATTLGVFLIIEPLIMLVVIAIFALIYAASRIASVGSLVAVVALPALLWRCGRSDAAVTLAIAVAALIVLQHRSNIGRLIRREENRA